jgi:hypothetical protein
MESGPIVFDTGCLKYEGPIHFVARNSIMSTCEVCISIKAMKLICRNNFTPFLAVAIFVVNAMGPYVCVKNAVGGEEILNLE